MSAIPFLPSRTVARPRSTFRVFTAARIGFFGVVFVGSYFGSSMFGNVMLEKTRREVRTAEAARAYAENERQNVVRQLERQMRTKEVESWVAANKFRAPIDLVKLSSAHGLVASNR